MTRQILFGMFTLMVAFGLAASAQAQVRINEIMIDSPGADDVNEFFELREITNSSVSLTGLSFLVIEGDGAASGVLDQALSLTGFTTNAGNGLFLWRASASVPTGGLTGSSLNTVDFAPDIENGTNTYLLVRGFTGVAIGTDLDTNNDGVLDVTPWASVEDAVAVTDGGAGDFMYAAQLGGLNFASLSFGLPDTIFRMRDTLAWTGSDVLPSGDTFNPYPYDPAEFQTAAGGALVLTDYDVQQTNPGSVNPALVSVPEPTSLAVFGLAIGGVAARHWTRRRNQMLVKPPTEEE